jgi:predicted dehydrogenase
VTRPLRAVLAGLGRIGSGYADDPVMARHYRFAAHAQVLEAHPAFDWVGAFDVRADARVAAAQRWPGLHVTDRPGDLAADVAVLATGPEARLDLLAALPGVRGVLVEKPLGRSADEGQRFLDHCRERGIAVQVCYWRRADTAFRALAAGGLEAAIGRPQVATLVYGNGLRNNGSHMIDFVRMLLGEVRDVSVPAGVEAYAEGPLDGDINLPFTMVAGAGVPVAALPLRFGHYRENAIEVWGDRGRLSILQEGLRVRVFGIAANRAMQGEREVDSDRARDIESTVGDAFYHLYENFADAMTGVAAPWSGGESAWRTESVVDAVLAAGADVPRAAEPLAPR